MDERKQDQKVPQVEMEMQLPDILDGPLELENGVTLNEGDMVEHAELGKGKILRIWTYTTLGTCLYVDWGANGKQEVHPGYVRKVV
ncbi:hypothetical protein KF728_17135 [Candidatus Obscuribacterales bacterium]|nr:hypothetical protein [Candidatus Obscuribacterales bacterium]